MLHLNECVCRPTKHFLFLTHYPWLFREVCELWCVLQRISTIISNLAFRAAPGFHLQRKMDFPCWCEAFYKRVPTSTSETERWVTFHLCVQHIFRVFNLEILQGFTALHYAAKRRKKDIVTLLVAAGANLEILNRVGLMFVLFFFFGFFNFFELSFLSNKLLQVQANGSGFGIFGRLVRSIWVRCAKR